MSKFSANLGFLWTELDLLSALYKAKKVGFKGIEFHWPYDVPSKNLKKMLNELDLTPICLNTLSGDQSKNENGLSAIDSKIKKARQAIDIAIKYAYEINCDVIHVMAGNAKKNKISDSIFLENLKYACDKAEKVNKVILIEVLNPVDAPGYYLDDFKKALDIVDSVGANNLKIMFDCYHLQKQGLNIRALFVNYLDYIGHIQIASVPYRDEPIYNNDCYKKILQYFKDNGWVGFIGAEYKPKTTTDDGIGWVKLYGSDLNNVF